MRITGRKSNASSSPEVSGAGTVLPDTLFQPCIAWEQHANTWKGRKKAFNKSEIIFLQIH